MDRHELHYDHNGQAGKWVGQGAARRQDLRALLAIKDIVPGLAWDGAPSSVVSAASNSGKHLLAERLVSQARGRLLTLRFRDQHGHLPSEVVCR